jgi:predicted nucleotidyltransferase
MGNEADEAKVARWIQRRLPTMLRRYGVEAAYLFGSWARDDADVYSDIDVMIVARSSRPFVERFLDYPELWRGAPAGIDLLIYTPAEFASQRRVNRFVRHALRHAKRII